MAPRTAAAALFVAGVAAGKAGSETDPLGKVLALMEDLTAKIEKEGEAEAAAYKEHVEWCDDVAANGGFEIKTATAQKEKLTASITQLSADIEASESTITDLAADISTNSADLKSATTIRGKEAADFAASEKELLESIDALGRAVTILEREMKKNPAAFAQTADKGLASVIQSLSVVVDAASFSVSDKNHLMALVQSQNNDASDSDDFEMGAPAAAAYKTHSSSIFDVLEDLKEKAESQLSELRKAEVAAKHNYQMLKQSLEDQLGADNTALSDEKKSKASSSENKAIAEGDLSVTVDDLAKSKEDLTTMQNSCMQVAADHDATTVARAEELKVIAQAIDILKSSTSGAVGQTYSLFQVNSGIRSHIDLARSEVVALVRKLARDQHSASLAQLASRIAAVERFGSTGGDPFEKVKGLIQNMIEKLESESQSEATEKSYCDDEMSKTSSKKAELDHDIEKLTTKIDQAAARSTELKADVKELQAEVAAMTKEQADNEKWRQDTHSDYVVAKKDLDAGLGGVRQALSVLREYYAAAASFLQIKQPEVPEHSAASGAGNSIIGVLEVVESDFASNLAKIETDEAEAADAHDKATQEYKITKASKDQDVKYKTQEFKGLDKSLSELSSDRETLNTELSAVNEYFAKLKDRCIAKAETYEQRKGRREAEIAGLKEALEILENEAGFVQKKKHSHRQLKLRL